MQTLPEKIFETAKKNPKKPALLYKKNQVYFPITYADLIEKINHLAAAFQQLGIQKGDKIAILSENRPEWVISDLAIMAAGAVSVPIHITLNPNAIERILNHSESKILVVSKNNLLHKVLLNKQDLLFTKKIILLEKLGLPHKETLGEEIFDWEEVLKLGDRTALKKIDSNSKEVCSIIYTSGTTGVPKGVMLTHENFLSNAEAVMKAIPLKPNDVFLSFLPLSHVLERLGGYYVPLTFGAAIAYAESMKQLPKNLKEVRPTILISVPRVFETFYDKVWDKVTASFLKKKLFFWALKQKNCGPCHEIADFLIYKKIRQQMGGRLRLTISGGASLSPKIAKFFLKLGVVILEGYGLTETSPVVSVNNEKEFKFGTVGKALDGVQIKISSDKEILVKGPSVTSGYYKNEEETKAVFGQEGWFHTGDLGFIDAEGFLTVIGRKKEMIITSGGKNVWPELIEHELDNDRFIAQSMAVGHNRKFISALVVPDWEEVEEFLKKSDLPMQEPQKLVKSREIIDIFQKRIDRVNQSFSDFEKVKKFKLLVDEFSHEREELTPTLKLRRHIIGRHYEKEIEEMYA